ncbi:hypothetical protein [Synechococcus sp. MIT S9508]|uniref:hypothetical protein n=1 Tax=Synechococcus sp. MIT S9508 TaxID=1801629 RepID=UPI001E4BF09F|nr:hypothetical protein [Synechococcus sp. MIT S9508]
MLALSCAAVLITPEAAAAPFNSATLRRIIDGREVFIDRRQASVNETADRGQELSTGSSRAEVLFDRRALGFLGKNSLIRLGEDCFRLDRGQVLVNGPQNTCLGSKVLGIRGTTYVLSVQDNGTYELAVLSGEASVGDAVHESKTEDSQDILSMYPTLNPVIGFGSSAWGGNASGETLGEAAGLILGDASFFMPLSQSLGSNLLYSYTTASSNFDAAWGASTELGYKWFNPDNRSISSVLMGYDGWDSAGCFQSQLALGGLWQKGRWQFGVNGGIPLDQCVNNLGYAIGQIGIPIADVGDQSITLSLSPYVLYGIGESFGGGRIGVNVPIGNQVMLSTYGQYDNLLDTVIGGQISYRFATKGGFVDDPNLQRPSASSPMPWQAREFNTGSPMQIAMGPKRESSPPQAAEKVQISEMTNLIGNTDTLVQLKAGEEATFSPEGVLLNQKMMSKDRFSQLIIETMSGQNLLPESHAINLVYKKLYGVPDVTLLSILGSDWLIAARTPYPRLRGANNLVVPNNKLPKTEKTYVCSTSGNYRKYYQTGNSMGVSNIADATRFQTTSNTGSCSGKLAGSSGQDATSPEFI